MNCPDIKEKLSAYLDGMIDPAGKAAVEEHLASCRQCSADLAELEKTIGRIRSLESVEPPPWLSQNIMSRIREEKKKKGLLQRLFYPLHIKVPIQAMATVLIAVITVYIFKTMQPEVLQQPVPSAEQESAVAPESGKKAEIPAAQAPSPALRHDRVTASEETRQKESLPMQDYAPAPPVQERMTSSQEADALRERTERHVPGALEEAREMAGTAQLSLDAAEEGTGRMQVPAASAPAPSRTAKKGTVLFSRKIIAPDDVVKVLEVVVAGETKGRSVLEVEYYIAERYDGLATLRVFPDIGGWTVNEIAVAQGRRVVRVSLEYPSSDGASARESSNLTIEISGQRENEERATLLRMVLPYRKIWTRP